MKILSRNGFSFNFKIWLFLSLLGGVIGFFGIKIEDYNRPKYKHEFIKKENRSIIYCKRKDGIPLLKKIYQSEKSSNPIYPVSISGNFSTIWFEGIKGVRILDTIDTDIVKFSAIKVQSNGIESKFSGYTHISNVQIINEF